MHSKGGQVTVEKQAEPTSASAIDAAVDTGSEGPDRRGIRVYKVIYWTFLVVCLGSLASVRLLSGAGVHSTGSLALAHSDRGSLAGDATGFPPLTGRVVDLAGVIPSPSRAAIGAKLEILEERSGIQLVVVALPSLHGSDVESFANRLFRHWKLGQAKKDNGVLFLIAPAERKMRIEVGYGLEGTLTDALSEVILSKAVRPRFRAGDFGGGIERGVDAIIGVLNGDAAEWRKPPKAGLEATAFWIIFSPMIILFAAFWVVVYVLVRRGARRAGGGGAGGGVSTSSRGDRSDDDRSGRHWSGAHSSSGRDGVGFSGAGGSSGGGGASSDW